MSREMVPIRHKDNPRSTGAVPRAALKHFERLGFEEVPDAPAAQLNPALAPGEVSQPDPPKAKRTTAKGASPDPDKEK